MGDGEEGYWREGEGFLKQDRIVLFAIEIYVLMVGQKHGLQGLIRVRFGIGDGNQRHSINPPILVCAPL